MIRQAMIANACSPSAYVRVLVVDGKDKLTIDDNEPYDRNRDLVSEQHGLTVVTERASAAALGGATIDYADHGGFAFRRLAGPESSYASHPGRMKATPRRVRLLRPELFGLRHWLGQLFGKEAEDDPNDLLERLSYHLWHGDSRAAVVVSVRPLLVAAYSDELDAVAMLHFPRVLVRLHSLREGSRLLTVNSYVEVPASDLTPGPNQTGHYGDFSPRIADFLSEDAGRLQERKAEIAEEEWQRCAELGRQYLVRPACTIRDGCRF
jgi:hypothetical protein